MKIERLRWRDENEKWDEEMKSEIKIWKASKNVSCRIWHDLIFRGRVPKIKVAQDGLKQILVLEFLKSDEICEIGKV